MSSKLHLTNTENCRFNPDIAFERATISCSNQVQIKGKPHVWLVHVSSIIWSKNMSIIAKNFEDNRTRFLRHKTGNFEQEKHVGENSFSFSCPLCFNSNPTYRWRFRFNKVSWAQPCQNHHKILEIKIGNGHFLASQL